MAFSYQFGWHDRLKAIVDKGLSLVAHDKGVLLTIPSITYNDGGYVTGIALNPQIKGTRADTVVVDDTEDGWITAGMIQAGFITASTIAQNAVTDIFNAPEAIPQPLPKMEPIDDSDIDIDLEQGS